MFKGNDFMRTKKKAAKVMRKRAIVAFPQRDPIHDERIVINVRGYRFETYRATLETYPDTFLGSAEKRNQFYDYENREVFLNRDHEVFQCVLFFYQSRGILAKPEWTPEDVFEEELRFYLLRDRFPFQEQSRMTRMRRMSMELDFKQNYCRKALWLLMEDPHSSLAATILAHICLAIIALSIFTYCMETLPVFQDNEDRSVMRKNQLVFFILESTFVAWFTMEYLVRFIASPSRWNFFKSPMGLVDLCVILPYFVTVAMKSPTASTAVSLSFLRTLRLIRVLRILKLSRYSRGMKVLGRTLMESFGQLKSLFLCLAMAVVISSSSLYYFEGYKSPDSLFTSIPESFWFTIITMTTVGYGDIVPQTIFGKISTALCLVSGIIILLCLPTPVFIMHFGRFYRICVQTSATENFQEPKTDVSILGELSNSGSIAMLPVWMKEAEAMNNQSLACSEPLSPDFGENYQNFAVSFTSTISIFKDS